MIQNEEKLDKCTPDVRTIVRALEQEFGNVVVTSGYRSPKYNKEVGGVSNSAHTKGTACDFQIPNVHVYKIASWLLYNIRKYNWVGMGVNIYTQFIHIDFKPRKSTPAIWQYSRDGKSL